MTVCAPGDHRAVALERHGEKLAWGGIHHFCQARGHIERDGRKVGPQHYGAITPHGTDMILPAGDGDDISEAGKDGVGRAGVRIPRCHCAVAAQAEHGVINGGRFYEAGGIRRHRGRLIAVEAPQQRHPVGANGCAVGIRLPHRSTRRQPRREKQRFADVQRIPCAQQVVRLQHETDAARARRLATGAHFLPRPAVGAHFQLRGKLRHARPQDEFRLPQRRAVCVGELVRREGRHQRPRHVREVTQRDIRLRWLPRHGEGDTALRRPVFRHHAAGDDVASRGQWQGIAPCAAGDGLTIDLQRRPGSEGQRAQAERVIGERQADGISRDRCGECRSQQAALQFQQTQAGIGLAVHLQRVGFRGRTGGRCEAHFHGVRSQRQGLRRRRAQRRAIDSRRRDRHALVEHITPHHHAAARLQRGAVERDGIHGHHIGQARGNDRRLTGAPSRHRAIAFQRQIMAIRRRDGDDSVQSRGRRGGADGPAHVLKIPHRAIGLQS